MKKKYYVAAFKNVINRPDGDTCVTIGEWGVMECGKSKVGKGVGTGDFLKFASANCSGKCSRIYVYDLGFWGYYLLYALIDEYHYSIYDGADLDDMPKGSIQCTISGEGVWYILRIKTAKGNLLTFYDAQKKFPFPIDKVAKDLRIPYDGSIESELSVLSKGLQSVYIDQGHDRITIGADCLAEYKSMVPHFSAIFPILTPDVDMYMRSAYRGAICYVKGGDHYTGPGCSYDACSLYPSQMHSQSGNVYPYGDPVKYEGAYTYDRAYPLYIQRCVVTATLKPDHMPCISPTADMGKSTAYLTTMDSIELTLTSVDMELLHEQYDVHDIYMIDGCKFQAKRGLFDCYINEYMALKNIADHDGDPVKRMIAKLFLNNLYGKFGTKLHKSNNIPSYIDKRKVYFTPKDTDGVGVYVPVACFVTAYGRRETVHIAQANWKYFDMCDTDSIHCHAWPDQLVGIPKGDGIGKWKLETVYERAHFVRLKCYVEDVIWDKKPKESSLSYKCAGATPEVKELFTWDNFKTGSFFPKAKPVKKYVKGGCIRVMGPFTITESL